ncbi:hypothetical protein FA13DRAFT_1729555 [Coprinellus micaceus]|uniref:RRM domain-containing protein n=1 Tax=Coprinellus micaceus TaxID=71717 RepID=A0A4Y7TIT0_COPMI|nr:hypothetical protein FA13DRAFT_1729555 [Coprinellus micaceus]
MSDPYVLHNQASRSPPLGPASSSSDSSSTATIASNSDVTNAERVLSPIVDRLETIIDSTTAAQSAPSNDAIEAAIRAAINSGESRSSPSVASSGMGGGDGRTVPPRDTRTQLFVGNLPYRVRWQDLKDLFRRAGTVLRADVSLGADNRSRGYGTVLLATAEDAGRAIDMFNGYEWQGRMLEVRVDRIGGPMSGESTTMQGLGAGMQAPMMGGVQIVNTMGLYQQAQTFLSPSPQFASQSQVQSPAFSLQVQPSGQQHQIFSPQPQHLSIGQIQSQLQIPGQSQFEKLQSQQYHGQQPQQAQQHPPSIPGRTLFVGNLPYHVQWQDLKDLFRRTPGGVTVLRADVALGPDGRSKGFGTVTLRTEEEAERAKRWFSGYEFNGRQLKVHHDRVPLSSTPSQVQHPHGLHSSAGSPVYAASPSLLSQQMMVLNLADALTADQHTVSSSYSRRSSSPSNTASSSSSRGYPPYPSSRLRNEALPSHTIQAYQQDHPARLGAHHARSHSGSVSGTPDIPPAAVSPVLANRPTHITLPAPSFNLDFDPSMASLESFKPPISSDYDGDMESGSGDRSRRESHSSRLQQTTPLQIHFKQYMQKERSDRERRQGEARDHYSSPPPQNEQQLYQLLHGSRQVSVAAGVGPSDRSPQPQHRQYYAQLNAPPPQLSLSHSLSSTTSTSADSAASDTPYLLKEHEKSYASGLRPPAGTTLRAGLSSGASSAANSSQSLPLAFGNRTRSSPSARVTRDASPDKLDVAGRPQSVVSTTGSTTSASESGMSTSLSGSSRTGSSVPAGSLPLRHRSPSKQRQRGLSVKQEKERAHPYHPGSITLPPPPHVVFPAGGAVEAASQAPPERLNELSGANVGTELFQQYHPFAKPGEDDAVFEQSGVPTIQAKKHTTGSSDTGSVSSRKNGKESTKNRDVQQWSETQAYHHWQQQQQAYQQQYHHQPPATPSHHPYPAGQSQLTPHGLPPMTPSMPPFTFVGAQMTPGFQSPAGIYSSAHPISPGGPSHFQQRRARMVGDTRMRHHPNAPGTLSLPPPQLAFVPHQQSPPVLSPASTVGPGTAGLPPHSYLLPLGSPGSPYALGPHHPLAHTHHQQPFQPPSVYGHVPHPLSHSFGHAVGPLGAMSPGAPWGRPGEIQPYGNAAVGGPARRSSGEQRSNRSRSVTRENEESEQAEPTQSPYMQSGGYWVYNNSMVEPKGYFDQLYMGPSAYRHEGPEAERSAETEGDDRTEGQRARRLQRPPLGVESTSSQSSGTPHRTFSMSTTCASSPDTLATSFGGEEEEMRRFVSEDASPTFKAASELVPRLQHSHTDPSKAAGLSQLSRRANSSEPK